MALIKQSNQPAKLQIRQDLDALSATSKSQSRSIATLTTQVASLVANPVRLPAPPPQQLVLSQPQALVGVVGQTNNNASPIVFGTPVYSTDNDAIDKAKADASGTKDVLGLVSDASITNGVNGHIQLNGVLTGTTAQWDTAFGTTGGLTKGTRYYLSASTAGQGTASCPSTAGQYVVELGIAISTTELNINIKSPILL